MNKVLLVCCGLFSMTCQAEFWQWQHQSSEKFNGVWQGVAIQDNGSSWPITVTLSSNDLYLINYPSFMCGGMLEIVGEYNSDLIFKEVLNYGIDNCHNNNSKIVLTKGEGDTLRYIWYYGNYENNGKKAAVATLTRQAVLSKYLEM